MGRLPRLPRGAAPPRKEDCPARRRLPHQPGRRSTSRRIALAGMKVPRPGLLGAAPAPSTAPGYRPGRSSAPARTASTRARRLLLQHGHLPAPRAPASFPVEPHHRLREVVPYRCTVSRVRRPSGCRRRAGRCPRPRRWPWSPGRRCRRRSALPKWCTPSRWCRWCAPALSRLEGVGYLGVVVGVPHLDQLQDGVAPPARPPRASTASERVHGVLGAIPVCTHTGATSASGSGRASAGAGSAPHRPRSSSSASTAPAPAGRAQPRTSVPVATATTMFRERVALPTFGFAPRALVPPRGGGRPPPTYPAPPAPSAAR